MAQLRADRRRVLRWLAGLAGSAALLRARAAPRYSRPMNELELFLCGDIMTGRGIDQVLAHSVQPALHEPWVDSAATYVELAERASGAIGRQLAPQTIWGDALAEWRRRAPALRIANLETAVTTSGDYDRDKGIHYRMHPANVAVLQAAGLDCCSLANNHVLDWGEAGLIETLAVLRAAGIATVGAGRDATMATAPVRLAAGGRGVVVAACATPSSGVPAAWAAGTLPGVNLLRELSDTAASKIGDGLRAVRRRGDIALVSIHWGGNWGYHIGEERRRFAHALIERAGVDIVCGHSSHHPLPAEVHQGRLILYGCGDFINDYEGIGGNEEYRPDLCLMYFPALDAAGALLRLTMVPMQIRRFRLHRAALADSRWLAGRLSREGEAMGTAVRAGDDGTLALQWSS